MVKERTKEVTLVFLRDQLLYDARNMAFVEGDILPEEAEDARHQLIDIGEDGNVDRVTRVLDLVMAHCVELCYPYSKTAVVGGSALTDVLTESQAYTLTLLLPDDFSQTTVNLLERLIHELLVCRVLADWLSITNTQKAQVWELKALKAEEDIKGALNARMGRVRRPMSPF